MALLGISGSGRIKAFKRFLDRSNNQDHRDQNFEGRADMQIQVSATNPGQHNVQIEESYEWWCVAGGWVTNLWPNGSTFYNLGPAVTPGTHTTLPWDPPSPDGVYDPVEHVVIMARVSDPTGAAPEEWDTGQFGIGADAATDWADWSSSPDWRNEPIVIERRPDNLYAVVPPLPVGNPQPNGPDAVFIAVKEPVDVVNLAAEVNGSFESHRTLLLTGQIVNWFKDPVVLHALESTQPLAEGNHFHMLVIDSANNQVVLDESLVDPSGWRLFSGPGGARGFTFGFDDRVASFVLSRRLPDTFTTGEILFQLTINGVTYERRVPVQLAPVDVLHWPVLIPNDSLKLADWNGPGENVFNWHNADVHMRYALDLVLYDQNGSTHSVENPVSMDQYYAFNAQIYSAADGIVRAIAEDQADKIGGGGTTNRIFIEHTRSGRKTYSVYAHIKQGSAAEAGISIGSLVRAGSWIGRVGWNGSSSEPHTHMAYYTLDEYGRYRALPFALSVHSLPTQAPVIGVPASGSLMLQGGSVLWQIPQRGRIARGNHRLTVNAAYVLQVWFDGYYAQDPNDIHSVAWRRLGSAKPSYPNTGEWFFDWDTTKIPDQGNAGWGTVNVVVGAKDLNGNLLPDDPGRYYRFDIYNGPGSLQWQSPDDNTALQGVVPLTAAGANLSEVWFDGYYATDPNDINTVKWRRLGSADQVSPGVWVYNWNTAALPDQGNAGWGTVNVVVGAKDTLGHQLPDDPSLYHRFDIRNWPLRAQAAAPDAGERVQG